MSLMFGKSKSVRGSKGKERTGRAKNPRTGRTIKYVEIYDTISSITAGLTSDLIEYTVPKGHCAELYALGVMPDYDTILTESNLLDITLATDDRDMSLKFLCNHLGMNSLPYGDRLSKQPMRLLDYPMRKGSLTPKFNEGVEIEIKATAGASAVDDIIRARARVLLYEPADVARVFGVTLSTIATLPGGIDQSLPRRLFAEYARLPAATLSKSKWTDLFSLAVEDYEQIVLSHLGILPHANSDSLKIYDSRLKWEAPEYEPYYKIIEAANALPFGDDDDEQPTAKLPSMVAEHIFNNTTMKVQIRDDGNIIPQYGITAQLFGVYRRVR